MFNQKIAVFGDKDSVLGFRAIGVDVIDANNIADKESKMKELAREYSIIFVTEDIAESVSVFINKLKARAYPVIIPIPGSNGASGYGIANVHKDVEKAIGSDILFNNKK